MCQGMRVGYVTSDMIVAGDNAECSPLTEYLPRLARPDKNVQAVPFHSSQRLPKK